MSGARTHTSSGTDAPPEARAIAAFVARARRRAGVMRVVEVVSIAFPAALVGGAIIALITPVHSRTAAMLVAGSGLALAAAAAYLTRPAHIAVADLADRRLALRDRIGTAFRLDGRDDAVARFITADAVQHLPPGALRLAFPFGVHRHATAAWLAAVVALCGWLVLAPGEADAPRGARDGVMITMAQAPTGNATDGNRTRTAARQTPGPAPEHTTAMGPDRPSVDTAGTSRDDASTADRGAALQQTRASRTERQPRGGDGPRENTTPGATAEAGARAGVGVRSDHPSGTGSAAQGSRRALAAAPGGSSAAHATPTSIRASGGVTGGAAARGEADGRAGRATAPGAPRALAGQDLIEAAITHEDVPARQRSFLRDYQRRLESLSQP